MTTASIATEVRYRATDSQGAWSNVRSFPAGRVVEIDGLQRDKSYDFQARSVSNCGARSAWVAVTSVIAPSASGTIQLTDLANNLALFAAPGANLIPNSTFNLWPAGGPTGWIGTFNGAVAGWAAGPQGRFGPASIDPPTWLEFATMLTTVATYTVTTNRINVPANTSVSLSIRYYITRTLATGSFYADIEYITAAGAHIAYAPHQFIGNADTGDYLVKKIEGLVTPAGCAQVVVRLYAENASSSGPYVYWRIGWVKLEIGPKCTPYNDFATQFGNLLTVAGSQQTIGDQRNMLPVTWAGVRSVLSSSPIAFSISGTTVHFTVAAVTVNAGGFTVAYNASSANVTQSAGTTVQWYLYYRDLTATGGSKTLNVSSSVQALAAYPDIVMLGYATVVTAASGGGSSGGGAGGGGFCVADDMWVHAGLRAGDAQIGDLFDCIDLPTAAGKHQRALQGVSRGTEECVRLITDDGCALTCSESTPFDTPGGRSLLAPEMLGEQVVTDIGVATVISLALVGRLSVTRAHLGGVSYAAGSDPTRRIYSHNAGNPPAKP